MLLAGAFPSCALILGLGVALGPPAAIGASAPACEQTSLKPARGSKRELQRATACLIDRQRISRGLSPLSSNVSLKHAAGGHSAAMVRKRFFAHGDLTGRIRQSGYPSGGSWRVGEVIAAGKGAAGSPRAIVRAWMHSAVHRSEILDPGFREIGVGVRHGSPVGGGHRAATYTIDFGVRG